MRGLRAACLPVFLFSGFIGVSAQIGGYGIFKFVNLPPSSRTSALGGNVISVKDDDVTLAVQNPSLLNKSMHNTLALSYIDYLADVSFGSAVYAKHFDSVGTGMIGMQYISYGSFTETDEAGNKLGKFSAGEYNLFAGFARDWKNFSYGGQFKTIYSVFEKYHSFGMAIDAAGTYANPKSGFTAAVVFKNMGYQFKAYNDIHEGLPFEIQAGFSEKPVHMPVRFSLILHDLQRFDLTYLNTNKPPKIDISTGNEIPETIPFSEKIARHFIVGAEILITKNFNLRVGYNHQRRKELTIPDDRGLVGYSYGFGFRVSKFHISYGHAAYSLAGASNTFTITTNFSEILHRKNQ